MSENAVSAASVKALRDITGIGMMECKKALQECAGDFDKARDLLRVKSGAKADKLAGRRATEGRIAFAGNDGLGVFVEIGCETDFVARDENMAAFAAQVADAVAAAGVAAAASPDLGEVKLGDGRTVEEARRAVVMKLGENISINRAVALSAPDGGAIAFYIHMGDKIAAMCAYSGNAEVARDVCMHIAAMRPRYIDEKNIPAAVLEHEQGIFKAQAMETGKPEEMSEKIAAGKLKKFVSDISLLEQAFIKDTEKKVGAVLAEAKTEISEFCLLIVGVDSGA